MGRTIVIGDIHGCFDELTDLLELIELGADDRVVAVGDLIVKGEKNREVLDSLYRRTGPPFERLSVAHRVNWVGCERRAYKKGKLKNIVANRVESVATDN